MDIDQRVLRLEERLAEEEHLVEQLNEVVTQMNLEFVKFQKALSKQSSQIQEFIANQSESGPADEKPPHY